MEIEKYSQHFPASIPVGSDADHYRLSTRHCATAVDALAIRDEEIAFIDGNLGYVLATIESIDDLTQAYPVYEKDADPGVATGNLSIRLPSSVKVQSIENTLSDLGYRITRIPGYAPHSAWLAPDNGDAAASLNGIGLLLEQIQPDHLEAQLLRIRSNR